VYLPSEAVSKKQSFFEVSALNLAFTLIFGGNIMAYGRITQKQSEILDYIKTQILNKGYPPSVRDICEAVHLKSTSSVHAHLETLEKNGYIRRDPTKPRAIEIIDDNFNLTRREVVNVPLVGRVAAGEPILAVENVVSYFPIPSEYMPNEEVFMLTVKGDSMVNVGIFEGDNIIVSKASTAHNGEIVVALVDDSATVKRFYKEDGHIRLQPENDYMEPIIVPDCQILGKVIGLVRLNIK
jgi:repressor LexA